MPFFHGAQGVNIHGGDFKDIHGNHNIYNSAVHNENSGNTTTTTTTNSNNDSSVRMGPTRNNYTASTHSGPKYSAKFLKGGDQDQHYKQHSASQSGYAAQQRRRQEELARQKVEAALKRSIEPKPVYNTHGIYAQDDREEEYAWQPSNTQPQYTSTRAQSEPFAAAPAMQSQPFPTPSPPSNPYGMHGDPDANPWSSSAAQPQPPFARPRSNPFPVPHTPMPEASPSPPPAMKSKNPFRNVVDPQGGQAPTWQQSPSSSLKAAGLSDVDMEQDTGMR